VKKLLSEEQDVVRRLEADSKALQEKLEAVQTDLDKHSSELEDKHQELSSLQVMLMIDSVCLSHDSRPSLRGKV